MLLTVGDKAEVISLSVFVILMLWMKRGSRRGKNLETEEKI